MADQKKNITILVRHFFDQSKKCDVFHKDQKKEGMNHMNTEKKESPRFITSNIKQDTFKQSTLAISINSQFKTGQNE